MAIPELERAVWQESKIIFNNPRLKITDIIEWTNGEIAHHDGEVIARLRIHSSITVAINSDMDKRKSA